MKNRLKLSRYEKCLFVVVENVVQKLTASVVLFDTKFPYTSTSAYFLAVIVQEELAKLILLPIARESGNLNNLISNRRSAFYSHLVKQKLISSYGFFKKDWKRLEEKKQRCLYVGFNKKRKLDYCRISRDDCYKEIKSALWAYQYQMKCINSEKEFSKDFIKALLFMTKILGDCVRDKLPSLHKDMMDEARKSVIRMEKNNKLVEKEFLESAFKNPYELIRIVKSIFGSDYKIFLKKIQKMSFDEMVQCLGIYL